MVERLRVQVGLLEDHYAKAIAGEREYLGEIADKLRLLVHEGGANEALMFRIAKLLDGQAWVDVKGAPGWTNLAGQKTGDRITAEEWLGSAIIAVGVPTGGDEPQMLTRRDIVLIWAQQCAGTHEDWSVDERCKASEESAVIAQGRHTLVGV
jgi:hypothetical protein